MIIVKFLQMGLIQKAMHMPTINSKEMRIPHKILEVLKSNYWEEGMYEFNKEAFLKKIRIGYSKYDFLFTDELLEELSLFYNIKMTYKFKVEGYVKSESIIFNLKKSLKYRQEFLNGVAEKLGVRRIIHIADINPGYLMIWLDEKGGVWGDYEKVIYYYGDSLLNGIENIIQNKYLIVDKK